MEKVREVENTAEIQLEAACAREDEIEARTQKAKKFRRENALAPRFWQAVGGHNANGT